MDLVVKTDNVDLARFRLGIHARMFAKALSRMAEGLHVHVEKEERGTRTAVAHFQGGVEIVVRE